MRGYSVSWGVPNFGDVLVRVRLNGLLESAGGRLRWIAAPSGWGKSLAAAGYVDAISASTLWIDACGQNVAPGALLSELLRRCHPALDDESSSVRDLGDLLDVTMSRACDISRDCQAIVLDDYSPSSEADVQLISGVARALECCGVRMLVTTRDEESLRWGGLRDAYALGIHTLALDECEAVTLAAEMGCQDQAAVRHVLAESSGHAAIFALMVRSMVEGGAPGVASACSNVAGGWLDRLAESGGSRLGGAQLWPLALLKQGTARTLGLLGVSAPEQMLNECAAIPLLRISQPTIGDSRTFSVHDLAEEWILRPFAPADDDAARATLARACDVLADRGEFARCAALLLRYNCDPVTSAWLLRYGSKMVATGMSDLALHLCGGLEVGAIMGSIRLLDLWSRALLAQGQPEEALGRAKAACELAAHEGDDVQVFESRMVILDCLMRLDRYWERVRVAESLMPTVRNAKDLQQRVAACCAIARAHCAVGQLQKASDAAEMAFELCGGEGIADELRGRVQTFRALIRALRYGDYTECARQMSASLPLMDTWLSERILARGNLAMALIETGRLARALPLARNVADAADGYMLSGFGLLQGLIAAGVGRTVEARERLAHSNELCVASGSEYDLAVNRILNSMVLRAVGDVESALSEAERAFERLSVMDYLGGQRLAALEVAACLLSLGDGVAARRWVESVLDDGCGENAHRALRAAMILAECDRLEGNLEAGVARIAEHHEHVISESSNWQIAMYVRAFPGLLGMFAAALGANALPVHMLRMILPENAEAALDECRGWLPKEEWRNLGQRVLGPQEFMRAERRGGEPACRVRLFGGLDVSLGQRSVAQRDWRKRKARLLFAMLVAKRGQEVPRELVLEHLWPEFSEERARNNFYVAWSAMKSALMGQAERGESCPYLENRGGRLRIVTDSVRSDLDEFEEALAEAHKAESDGEIDRALDAYSRLAHVYRGDLLPGDLYDDWFSGLRDRCRLEFADAMVRAGELLLERDDPCEALVYARRALQVEPLREDIYQAVMRCSIAAGQRNGAIDTFLQCRTRLADDLGLDPSAETMALYQQILVMEDRPRYDDFGLS